jgi:GDP-mannose transporter
MLKNRSSDSGADLEKALLEPTVTVRRYFGIHPSLFSGLCYCLASGSMVLLNKYALASFNFKCPTSLLGFQCLLSAVLVKTVSILGYVDLQPLKRDLVATWLPVNFIFVGMTGTSFYALQTVGVGKHHCPRLFTLVSCK